MTKSQKWRPEIRIDGKSKYLGYYEDEVVAAKAYDKEARQLEKTGLRHTLNFPTDEERRDGWVKQYVPPDV